MSISDDETTISSSDILTRRDVCLPQWVLLRVERACVVARQAATCGPECRRARRTLPTRSFVIYEYEYEYEYTGYSSPAAYCEFLSFPTQNYETPQFLGIIPDFVKNSMLCTFSLFSCTKYDKVEISIGRKWRKVKNEVEKSGEKSNAYA